MGGERGKIGQTKISSKGEKEREQLMEPEETVTALKIRERVRSKKEGEEDRSWKDRGVELKFREKVWRRRRWAGEAGTPCPACPAAPIDSNL